MCDNEFVLDECIWNCESVMEELIPILRQDHNYCTDMECFNFSQPPSYVPSTIDFLTTCLMYAFVLVLYPLRPNWLRSRRNDNAKDRQNGRDSNEEPPAPPPTMQ